MIRDSPNRQVGGYRQSQYQTLQVASRCRTGCLGWQEESRTRDVHQSHCDSRAAWFSDDVALANERYFNYIFGHDAEEGVYRLKKRFDTIPSGEREGRSTCYWNATETCYQGNLKTNVVLVRCQ
jgi:hypothetical protein